MATTMRTLRPRKDETLQQVCEHADFLNRIGSLDAQHAQAAYGITWARQTGRLPGVVEQTLAAMRGREAGALICEVAAQCRTVGAVPNYLIGRYCV